MRTVLQSAGKLSSFLGFCFLAFFDHGAALHTGTLSVLYNGILRGLGCVEQSDLELPFGQKMTIFEKQLKSLGRFSGKGICPSSPDQYQ